MGILIGVVAYNTLNGLVLNDLLTLKTRVIISVVYMIPPPLIYTYWYTYIYGRLPRKRLLLLHFTPLAVIFTITFFIAYFGIGLEYVLTTVGELTAIYHFCYPLLMLRLLKSFYGMRRKSIRELLRYNSEKVSILKVFMVMMIIHSVIFFFQHNHVFFMPRMFSLDTFMKIHIFFMIALQYLITWIIINMPVVIHFSDKRIGLASFRKHERSVLTADEAKSIAQKINQFMQETKSYTNPLYSSQNLSSDLDMDYSSIAATLNGLLGQSFNDYINNYRIEEVKRFFANPKYDDKSILDIAFEAGFNSKAAFYSAFKKFTGETPSQCRKRLRAG